MALQLRRGVSLKKCCVDSEISIYFRVICSGTDIHMKGWPGFLRLPQKFWPFHPPLLCRVFWFYAKWCVVNRVQGCGNVSPLQNLSVVRDGGDPVCKVWNLCSSFLYLPVLQNWCAARPKAGFLQWKLALQPKHLVNPYSNNSSGELQKSNCDGLQGSHSVFTKQKGNMDPVVHVAYPQIGSRHLRSRWHQQIGTTGHWQFFKILQALHICLSGSQSLFPDQTAIGSTLVGMLGVPNRHNSAGSMTDTRKPKGL